MKKDKKSMGDTHEFSTLPISQADRRAKDTKTAVPSDENVERAKNWVDFNKK